MIFLLTGAEVEEVNGSYIVIYQSRIIKNKLNKEEAIEIALNETLLNKLYYGCQYKTRYEY